MLNPGARIYQYRLRKGYTQQELASSCGLPQANLSNIEKGKRDLTVSTLVRIAASLGVKPSVLLEEEAPEKKAALTRKTIEKIAEVVLNPSVRAAEDIHKFAALFRAILPEGKPRGSFKKMNDSWLELKRHFTPQEIRGIFQRIQDAEQRHG